ncbi:MAG: hypothetical protein Q8Q08_05485 [Candidatus Omnitrophota bacterium]|nr:hypothetical protein [Candidatus Omnitrophota bacterium]MDZ4242518.1 hypothetical protein [Candidatus Omnitrophota bacterium]
MKIKLLKTVFVAVLASLFLRFFCGLPERDFKGDAVSRDILLRRSFLLSKLDNRPTSADFFVSKNIEFTGEWTLGTYSMAAAALTNIAMMAPETAEESAQAIARWIGICLTRDVFLFDEAAWGESPLEETVLAGEDGHIGYYGHLNLMLGCYALLSPDGRFADLHGKISAAIARRMKKYPHRHVETYPGQNYPPDNTVAAASLRIADMVSSPRYENLIEEWVSETRGLEVGPYGLVTFQIDTLTGRPLQASRGSNNGWNSFYLALVDEPYAREQFLKIRKFLLKRAGGFAFVREYPSGHSFAGDRDTGPVVGGIGATATAFTIAGAIREKDVGLRNDLLRSIELAGTTMTRDGQRRYAAAPIVGDAIILAMKTARSWRPLWKGPDEHE